MPDIHIRIDSFMIGAERLSARVWRPSSRPSVPFGNELFDSRA